MSTILIIILSVAGTLLATIMFLAFIGTVDNINTIMHRQSAEIAKNEIARRNIEHTLLTITRIERLVTVMHTWLQSDVLGLSGGGYPPKAGPIDMKYMSIDGRNQADTLPELLEKMIHDPMYNNIINEDELKRLKDAFKDMWNDNDIIPDPDGWRKDLESGDDFDAS